MGRKNLNCFFMPNLLVKQVNDSVKLFPCYVSSGPGGEVINQLPGIPPLPFPPTITTLSNGRALHFEVKTALPVYYCCMNKAYRYTLWSLWQRLYTCLCSCYAMPLSYLFIVARAFLPWKLLLASVYSMYRALCKLLVTLRAFADFCSYFTFETVV